MTAALASRHVTASEVELYVLDALDPPACRRLERHVGSCAACAASLAAEARLEVLLPKVVESVRHPPATILKLPDPAKPPARPPRSTTPPRLRMRASSALAAAAAVALFVHTWRGHRDERRTLAGTEIGGQCWLGDSKGIWALASWSPLDDAGAASHPGTADKMCPGSPALLCEMPPARCQ